MKRILYLSILCIMLMNMICPGTVGAADADANSAYYNNSIQLLSTLKIAEYKASFDEALNTGVTRGESVNAVMRCIINDSGNTVSGKRKSNVSESPYNDVASAAWYAANIASAKAMGIIDNSGSFRPEDMIGYDEFIKIAVCAAGYAPTAEKAGGYPIGYNGTAISLGLVKNTSGLTDELSQADFAIMLANLLKCKPMIQKSYGTISKCEITDRSLLESVYNVYSVKGRVVTTPTSSVSSDEFCHEGFVGIAAVGGDDVTLFSCGDMIMDSLLGRVADIYYKTADDGYLLLCAMSHYGDRDLKEISGEEFDGFSASSRTIEYTKHYSDSLWDSGSVKNKAVIPTDCDLLINGVFSSNISYAFDILEGKELNLDTVRLIDSDYDGVTDVIDVWAYYTFFPLSVDKTNKSMTDKYTRKIIDLLDDSKKIQYKVISGKNMSEVDFGTVGKNAALAVFEGSGTNKTVYKFITGTASVSGTVEETEDTGSDFRVKADGIVYEFSASLIGQKDKIKVDSSYSFYLDFNGKIGGYKLDVTTTGFDEYGLSTGATGARKDFGIVISSGISKGIDGIISLKIYSKTGVIDVYDVDSRCTLNTQRYTADTYNLLTPLILKKLVEFELNSEGLIKTIATPTEKRDDNTLSYATGFNGTIKNLTFKENANVFFGTASTAIGSQTVVINAPSNDYTGDMSRAYSIGSKDAFSNDREYDVEAFYLGTDSVSADILINYSKSAQSLSSTEEFMVVQSVTSVINSDGMDVKEIKGLKMNYDKTFQSAESEIKDTDGNTLYVSTGDIIQLSINAVGECAYVRLLYDYDNPGSYTSPGSYTKAGRIMKACVYDYDSNVMQIIKNTFVFDENMLSKSDATELHNLYYARICVYEKGKKPGAKPVLRKGTISDLVSYRNDSINYSRVVVANHYGNPGAVVVIYKD